MGAAKLFSGLKRHQGHYYNSSFICISQNYTSQHRQTDMVEY